MAATASFRFVAPSLRYTDPSPSPARPVARRSSTTRPIPRAHGEVLQKSSAVHPRPLAIVLKYSRSPTSMRLDALAGRFELELLLSFRVDERDSVEKWVSPLRARRDAIFLCATAPHFRRARPFAALSGPSVVEFGGARSANDLFDALEPRVRVCRFRRSRCCRARARDRSIGHPCLGSTAGRRRHRAGPP